MIVVDWWQLWPCQLSEGSSKDGKVVGSFGLDHGWMGFRRRGFHGLGCLQTAIYGRETKHQLRKTRVLVFFPFLY